MPGRLELLVAFWKEWGIQWMVLVSFALQVTLLVMADVRRHKESRVVRTILWSAYVLADTTAVYALGHMSVATRSPEHELTAFWAPLLLVHLGGQDNITAYAIEDNQLWLRHLQVFGVQVLAAAYVLYASPILRRQTLLLPAAILMFVVGVLKYDERVWALMRASGGASSSLSATSYRAFQKKNPPSTRSLVEASTSRLPLGPQAYSITESMLLKAYVQIHDAYAYSDKNRITQLVGMQLSMMYDLLYTKAAVVHTWHGWCIRVVSQLSAVAALLLFHASTVNLLHGGCSRVDVTVTYVLLGGAVILEIMSMLRAIFSTWTCVLLQERGWHWLAHVLHFLPWFIRYWSGSIGQHDLFRLCRNSSSNLSSRIARWVGHEDLWDSRFYSWSISVPEKIIDRVVELLLESEGVGKESPDHITNSRGQRALKRGDMYDNLKWTVEMELDESIIVWHIATYVFNKTLSEVMDPDFPELLAPLENLSCYMFFLLVVRPYMLPYPVSRQRYVQLCYDLIISGKDLSRVDIWEESLAGLEPIGNNTFKKGCQLANYLRIKMRRSNGVLETIYDVWVEMICYTAFRCNENSHANHLSNGGEIMTAVALAMLYMSNGQGEASSTLIG